MKFKPRDIEVTAGMIVALPGGLYPAPMIVVTLPTGVALTFPEPVFRHLFEAADEDGHVFLDGLAQRAATEAQAVDPMTQAFGEGFEFEIEQRQTDEGQKLRFRPSRRPRD